MIPKRGVEITAAHPLYIHPNTIWNHFCCVILFATKWGLNFHGLHHIVLRCTRLQSEASRRGQSEREGTYIYLVCGLMAPYVCEEKWQAEVGSERRPTTPPRSHWAPHLLSLRHMAQTTLPCMKAVLPHRGCSFRLNILGWVCKSLCTPMDITQTAVIFISLTDKHADGRPIEINSATFGKHFLLAWSQRYKR